MSLIQTIKSRPQTDLINEGSKVAFTGTVTNGVTDSVIWQCPSDRSLILCGITVSTSASTSIQVSIGWKTGSDATTYFFTGFVVAGGPITITPQLGDWYRSDLGQKLVITTSGTGVTAYSLDCRMTSSPAAVNYVSHEGSVDHAGRPVFPPPSGKTRGQMEI